MCCCFALLAQLSLANGYFTYSGHSHVLLGTSWYVCVLLGSTCGLQLIMCSWYAVLYNLSSNFHLQVGTQQCFGYSPVLLGTPWYVWVLLVTSKYLRVCNESYGAAPLLSPNFPLHSSPSQPRNEWAALFWLLFKFSHCGEMFIYLIRLYHSQYSIQSIYGKTAGVVFQVHSLGIVFPDTLLGDSIFWHTF